MSLQPSLTEPLPHPVLACTLGIIHCPETGQALLLNRQKKPWMGRWNGVGGKLDPGESSYDCIVRETLEETGLQLPQYILRGVFLWDVECTDKISLGNDSIGGMYLFTAEVSRDQVQDYTTPRMSDGEGILDWKSIDWITNPQNLGLPDNIPPLFAHLFNASSHDAFHTTYRDGKMQSFQYLPGMSTYD